MALILASKSRSRKIVLELLGLGFSIEPANVDERSVSRQGIEELTRAIAGMKAEKVAKLHPLGTVVGIDTMLCRNGEFIGQATDEKNAAEMLGKLLGEWHTVCSGYCVICNGKKFAGHSLSRLKLKAMPKPLLENYVASGLWRGLAGAYNIISPEFECFVDKVEGSKLNIVGFPAEKLLPLVERLTGQKASKSIKEIELELFKGKL